MFSDWYQVRYFFTEPFLVHIGTIVKGRITFKANEKLSYDVDICANVNGIEKTNRLDLKNPNFRYVSGSGMHIASANYYYDGTLATTNTANAQSTTIEQSSSCRFSLTTSQVFEHS